VLNDVIGLSSTAGGAIANVLGSSLQVVQIGQILIQYGVNLER